LPAAYALLGGRGLTSRLVHDEVPPLCHPLGADNKLVLAPGLLTGTTAPCAVRMSVGSKSPLTGGIKEANVGGMPGRLLAGHGVAAVVLEGAATEPTILELTAAGLRLLPAGELWRLGTYALVDRVRATFGPEVEVVCIGPAGEMRLAAAGIAVTDSGGRPCHYAARGGLGAVMGSKMVKALVIHPEGASRAAYADLDAFRAVAGPFAREVAQEKRPTLGRYGTAVMVMNANAGGSLPTRNFRRGSFEFAERISGEQLRERIEARGGNPEHACARGCPISCSNVYLDEDGQYLTSSLEYETIAMFGANCQIADLDQIAALDRMCDDLGLDTIETGATLALAMDAGLIPWGDGVAATDLLREVAHGTPLGRLTGSGAAVFGRVYGIERVPAVKGQALAAIEPRALKGLGVTYATSPMGADHTAACALAGRAGLNPDLVPDPLRPEHQVETSVGLQIIMAAIDSSGLCYFVGPSVKTIGRIAQMLAAKVGRSVTYEDVVELGKDVLRWELDFNRRAGFTSAEDRLPEFFRREPLPEHGVVFDVPQEELEHAFDILGPEPGS
jgi:aldehyde:ferredoxin oxidoreductase